MDGVLETFFEIRLRQEAYERGLVFLENDSQLRDHILSVRQKLDRSDHQLYPDAEER